jgi:alkylation response protein AidB-like acyl-CoA dehydrogenase
MKWEFSYEEQEVLKAVRSFVQREILPVAGEMWKSGEMTDGVRKKFLSMDLLKSAFPLASGGAGGTFTALIIALKELSYGSTVPAWILFENFMLAWPLHRYGSDSLKAANLPGLLSLESLGALAFTEADTGSDPSQLKTRAEKVAGGWRINGTKRFITHSGSCDRMILFARTGDRVTAFLVNSENRGYQAGRRESFVHMPALDNGDVILEDYFAPEDHVIGKEGSGFEILLATEALGKIAFSSLFVGMAERALDLALDYAGSRLHRGSPIGRKFQMIQYKLASMKSRVEAMNALLFRICAQVDRGEDIFRDAALLKILVATDIKKITADAMEIHGAYGLSREYEIGTLYKAAISAQVVMGSLDIQRVIVARDVLSGES